MRAFRTSGAWREKFSPQKSAILHEREIFSTGHFLWDQVLGGGLARGRISEIAGGESSGRTALVFSILSQATALEESVAYIDAFDMFDPFFATHCGVELSRLLWIRCGSSRQRSSSGGCQVALKAADLLVRAGGFGVIVLDLAGMQEHPYRIPFSCWWRLKQRLEGSRTLLLALNKEPVTASASCTLLQMQCVKTQWGDPPLKLLKGKHIKARLIRGKGCRDVSFCSFLPL
ncbi:MAG: hypothetical protein HY645_14200 [Acidobacteria bacterium]|nr:hypothetical protein [Acidobacteriota bacterium]